MKKLLACFLALALLIATSCCAMADEQETITSGDWEYRVLADGTAEITRYSNSEATSIQIPETLDGRKVTNITGFALLFCLRNSSFAVSPDHPTLAVIDGVLFSKPDKRLIAYPSSKESSTYAIPQGIETIGEFAFSNCISLTSISIPNSITNIEDCAFYDCFEQASISSFVVSPDHPTLAAIDGVLFSKPDKRLIAYPSAKESDTYAIPQGIEVIGKYAFSFCHSLTDISIPDSITSIGEMAFSWCSSLTSISIPDSVTSFGFHAFSNCSSLTSISIPNSVTNIGNCAFTNCSSLERVSIPSSVTSIGLYAFSNCSSLTSISIPDSITSIGIRAFDECPNLTLIVGRNSYAEQYAKENNIPYTLQDAKENNASYALPDDSDDWKYRILADGTAQITEYSNPNATSVQIPETLNGMKVTDVAENAFLLCLNNSSFVVSPDHPTLAVIDGVLFSKPDKRLISYPKAKEGDSYVIPQGIKIIGKFAFSYCTSLTSISLPNSVTSIENDAFAQCSSLTSISIPDSVTSIGDEAFSYCSSLTSISIPDSVTSIRVGAFANCSSLTSISIPDGVTSIKYATFADCISLTSISIPDSVTRISDGAFNNCPNLTLTVGRNSYAEQYAKGSNIPFAYSDANDWLTK